MARQFTLNASCVILTQKSIILDILPKFNLSIKECNSLIHQDKSVISSIPTYFDSSESPFISYKYNKPRMWYVRPAKPQISLRIRAV